MLDCDEEYRSCIRCVTGYTSGMIDNFRRNLRHWLIHEGRGGVTALARKADVNRVTIHKILSGEIEPSLTMCGKLAAAMGVKPAERIFQKSRKLD